MVKQILLSNFNQLIIVYRDGIHTYKCKNKSLHPQIKKYDLTYIGINARKEAVSVALKHVFWKSQAARTGYEVPCRDWADCCHFDQCLCFKCDRNREVTKLIYYLYPPSLFCPFFHNHELKIRNREISPFENSRLLIWRVFWNPKNKKIKSQAEQ